MLFNAKMSQTKQKNRRLILRCKLFTVNSFGLLAVLWNWCNEMSISIVVVGCKTDECYGASAMESD